MTHTHFTHERDTQMYKWTQLLEKEQYEEWVAQMQFSSVTEFEKAVGTSFTELVESGVYVDVDEWMGSEPPTDAKLGTKPVVAVQHNRLQVHQAVGWIDGFDFWMCEEVFESLF